MKKRNFTFTLLLSITHFFSTHAFGDSPRLKIEPSLRAQLGAEVTKYQFRFHREAKGSLTVKNGVHLGTWSGQKCSFKFEYHGKGATEFLDMMSITVNDVYHYQVNSVKYYENGVIYIAWQKATHAYQISFPRMIIRIFNEDGKTFHAGFQNGFEANEQFCLKER